MRSLFPILAGLLTNAAASPPIPRPTSIDPLKFGHWSPLTGFDAPTGLVGGTSLAMITGESAYQGAGRSVALAGDVDGDGQEDLMIGGTDTRSSYDGDAWLVLGPILGDISLSDADAHFQVSSAEYLGRSVASAGDLNSDGFGDLLVGLPTNDLGGSNSGAALLFLGPVFGELESSDADATYIGEGTSDQVGWALSSAEDLTGDEMPDVVIGAYSHSSAYVVSGARTGNIDLLYADAEIIGSSSLGRALTANGDLNGDGLGDLVLGAPTATRNSVFVLEGPLDGYIDVYDAMGFVETYYSWGIGTSVVSGSDADGDGYDDLLVGYPGSSSRGEVLLFLGPFEGNKSYTDASARIQGESSSDYAEVPSFVGDLDSDGGADIAIGAYYHGGTSRRGAVYVLLSPVVGSVTLTSAYQLFDGIGADQVGYALSAGGDLDGDGLTDFVAGAPYEDSAATDAGAVYLLGSSLWY